MELKAQDCLYFHCFTCFDVVSNCGTLLALLFRERIPISLVTHHLVRKWDEFRKWGAGYARVVGRCWCAAYVDLRQLEAIDESNEVL